MTMLLFDNPHERTDLMSLIKLILACIEIFFLIYLIGYSTFLFLSVIIGSNVFFDNNRKKLLKNEISHTDYFPISLIVPAHNESVTIIDSINSLLTLDYTLFEIIIVDDGSTDDTSKNLIEYFKLSEVFRPIKRVLPCQDWLHIYENTPDAPIHITVIEKLNGGKADALNMGINASTYPYFITMDADSLLQHDALQYIMNPILIDDTVVAVGGMIQISNDVTFSNGEVSNYCLPKKLLPCMQILEYERSFLAARLLLDSFNGNLIISGAFGLFKKEIIINIGGYDVGSMGEDMELVVKLHAFCRSNRLPYRIAYAHEAICWTQVPSHLRDLIKQRRRWHIGLFQSLMKHRKIFSNFSYGRSASFSYFYFMIYELLSPVIELIGFLSTLLAFYCNLLNISFMFIFFATYSVYGILLTLISFLTRNYLNQLKLTPKDIFKAILIAIPENIILRPILSVVRMVSLLTYRAKKTQWGNIKRYQNKTDLGETS